MLKVSTIIRAVHRSKSSTRFHRTNRADERLSYTENPHHIDGHNQIFCCALTFPLRGSFALG